MPRTLPSTSLLRRPLAVALLALWAVGLCAAAPASRADEVLANPLCDTDPELLCLLGERFEVRVAWRDHRSGSLGEGQKTKLTDRSGTFWFFHPDNVELIVKIQDGRPVNGDFWVFVGTMTDLAFSLTVSDRETNFSRTYVNPAGKLLGLADTEFSSGSQGAVCGTIVGIGCDEGFYCELPAGFCSSADLGGLCTAIPAACPANVIPVCGCDGVTYPNDCVRGMAQVQKDHDGACEG